MNWSSFDFEATLVESLQHHQESNLEGVSHLKKNQLSSEIKIIAL